MAACHSSRRPPAKSGKPYVAVALPQPTRRAAGWLGVHRHTASCWLRCDSYEDVVIASRVTCNALMAAQRSCDGDAHDPASPRSRHWSLTYSQLSEKCVIIAQNRTCNVRPHFPMKLTVESQCVTGASVPVLDVRKPWSHAAAPGIRRLVAVSATLMALGVLSGCKDEKNSAAQPENLPASHVREAVEQSIRSGIVGSTHIQFRGVQVYTQAMPQRMAVCGQVNPFADNPNLFVPFVAFVTKREGLGGEVLQDTVEQHIATNTSQAGQVYIALVTYCYDKGGPAPAPRRSVLSIPPLPDTISAPPPAIESAGQTPVTFPNPTPLFPPSAHRPSPELPIVRAAVPDPISDQPAALGSVTMRQNGNLHSSPQGPVIVVVPRGTVIQVFSRAPGGWYQVGGSAPWGWVHESMLDKH